MKRKIILVSGRVQGVYFRASAKEAADRMNIHGLVRNEPDGSVYIDAEGEATNLDDFIAWCNNGPRHAEVLQVKINDAELIGYDAFRIVR